MNIINANYKMYHFNPQVKPLYRVNSGDTLIVYTTEAPDGQIKDENEDLIKMDITRANPTTGPIEVVQAKPGDILRIFIKDIQVADVGYMAIGAGNKLLSPFKKKSRIKLFKIIGKKVYFNLDRLFPLQPMIGVIGTTPLKSIKTNLAGPHGGNMDNRSITINSYVYLPVFIDGALFGIGDVHAAMGDGEIAGCGIEISAKVILQVDLLKYVDLRFPIVESEEGWTIMGEGPSIKEALRVLCNRMIGLLIKYCNMNKEEASFFLGSYVHFGICQSAFLDLLPQFVVKATIYNKILNFSIIKKVMHNQSCTKSVL